MGAQGHQDDESQEKQRQAICYHKTLLQASMSPLPFQKFVCRALLEPAVRNNSTTENMESTIPPCYIIGVAR